MEKATKGNQYTGKMVTSTDGSNQTKYETIRKLGFADARPAAIAN